eukprot:2411627-Ditylum_brightwellii.AAC.1
MDNEEQDDEDDIIDLIDNDDDDADNTAKPNEDGGEKGLGTTTMVMAQIDGKHLPQEVHKQQHTTHESAKIDENDDNDDEV